MSILRAAPLYAGMVISAGFVLGTIRTLWLAPQVGDIAAVALELPLMLTFSWLVAGIVLRHMPLPRGAPRVVMGAAAFALLMLAEAALALTFGQPLSAWAAALLTPAGGLGLAGQLAFAAIPALRR